MNSSRRNGLIVLLGAGASIDANMPDVRGLSDAVCRPFYENVEQLRALEQLELVVPSARSDYESLFQWLSLAMTHRHFRALIGLGGCQRILFDMARSARRSIVEVLRRPTSESSTWYLSALAELRPWAVGGRVDTYTLNYDLCVERACRAAGVKITTGFEHGAWSPDALRSNDAELALHKLHGSINWFSALSPDGLTLEPSTIVERDVDDPYLPQLVLGPGSKVQADDPYFFLLNRFHDAVQRAAVCVVIGYGWHDDHVTKRLDYARQSGMLVLDVNPEPTPLEFGDRAAGLTSLAGCTNLRLTAREALTGKQISEELRRLGVATTD